MEKRSKKRNRKDSVSITKIYETIKDKGFMQELWLDVMSDMKQKPSYIRLKEMVEKVIKSAVDNYATKPKDHEERLKTRTIFTDLSIMTYTIDTLISELLRKKLKDEFKTIISNIVDELKNKPESSHAQENINSVHMLEGIGEMICNGVDKESTNQTESESTSINKNEHNSNCSTLDVSFIKMENSSPRSDEHSVDFPDSDTIAFSIVETESMSNTNNANKNVTTNLMSCMSLKKNSQKKTRTKKKKVKKHVSKKSGALSSNEDSEIDVVNVSEEDMMSDDSSFSFRSASSVHTSDLSSYEDTISISSEDEQGVKIKRHVPFKDAYELCVNGKLEELREVSRSKSNVTYSPSSSMPVNNFNNNNESPKRLPSRIRKPNSKYSSDDVICSIKHLNTQIDSSPSVSSNKSDRHDMKRNSIISHSSDSPKRRGRPPKNKNVEINGKVDNMKLSTKALRIDRDVSSPSKQTPMHGIEVSRKRGRPPKNIPQVTTTDGNKSFNVISSNSEETLHTKHSLNQSTSLKAKQQETSDNEEPEIKRGRGRPPSSVNKGITNKEPYKHTVESFTSLEERLCVKDQVPLSPSKSSTKSYVTSDLYKPRSDFRGCFDSRGNSRAITLFSN